MENLLSKLPKINLGKKKRLGRGLSSGRGAKSGRGTTRHQKARESIPLHFEGGQGRMVKRFPLLRGKFKNKSINKNFLIVSLDDLNVFKDNEVVDLKKIISKGLIKTKKTKKFSVKILNKGKIEKKLVIKLPVSCQAKAMIEKSGGRVELP